MNSMTKATSGQTSARGRVGSADRLQRLVIGVILITLNAIGLIRFPDWTKWLALVFQMELVATGLLGWCPFYWVCRVQSRTDR